MHNHQAFEAGFAAAIVVAAGVGARIGDDGEAKQFRLIGGRPMFLWSVLALLQCEKVASVVVVASGKDRGRAAALLPPDLRIRLAVGGETRTDSVRAGLAAIEAGNRTPGAVLIHDAARPGLTPDVVDELLQALKLEGIQAAAPALPVTDALKAQQENGALRTVNRDGLMRVQTPQAFRWETIKAAYDGSSAAAVDDLALVEALGAQVMLTPGRAALMKVTHKEDLAVVERLIAAPTLRVGSGFDVHGFEPGDAVVLCGVRIPHSRKLQGHSDADAGWHALTDAILGAAALGDIGDHFPPSDPQWKGAASIVFLKRAVELAAERGLRVVNADITLLAERPKISPHREAMRVATAQALGISVDAVSVKATTTEKLGFVGREEGIAAQASVLLGG